MNSETIRPYLEKVVAQKMADNKEKYGWLDPKNPSRELVNLVIEINLESITQLLMQGVFTINGSCVTSQGPGTFTATGKIT